MKFKDLFPQFFICFLNLLDATLNWLQNNLLPKIIYKNEFPRYPPTAFTTTLFHTFNIDLDII